MNKSTLLFFSAITALTFSNCGGGEKSEEIETGDSVKTEEPKINQVSETFFQVPSPGEMLTFIKMVGGKNNKNTSFLNSPANEKNYTDSKSKAINFGIYSCDLSYCSIFGIGSESLKYFKTVKTMGDQIGVSNAIKPEVLKRFESNIGISDSLAVITDSGGITEETTVMGIPCMTLRNNTERPETVEIGSNELIGTDPRAIKPAMEKLFSGNWKKGSIPELWDGKTAERIVEILTKLNLAQ